MNKVFLIFFILAPYYSLNAVSVEDQINHITRRKQESDFGIDMKTFPQVNRRALPYELGGTILGVPSAPRHLPEAEPILPGHTLIRPAFGMLKSAVKFPHRELENGAGVNGNIDNLGMTWNGRNERLEYSGFRRNAYDWSSSDELRPNLGRREDSRDTSSSSEEDNDNNYARYLRNSKVPRRSNYRNSEDDYTDLDMEDYSDAVSKVYKKLIASTLNILQNKKSQRRNVYNQEFASSSSHEDFTPHVEKPIYKNIKINKKGVKGREEGRQQRHPQRVEVLKEITPWYNENKMNTNSINKFKQKLWNLQMTGDHVNYNSNAPDIHELIPKKYMDNEPEKHWVYWGEMRPKKRKESPVFASRINN